MINFFRLPSSNHSVGSFLLMLSLLLLTTSRPVSAAAPRGFAGSTMLAADRADLALDTGLWRSEFLKAQDEEESAAPGTSDDENHQSLQAIRTTDVRNKPDLANLEIAAEEYFENGEVLPVESMAEANSVAGDVAEHLSDWEQAICNVSDGKALSAGQKGPSIITAVVAVVGLIVVIGAYMKK